MDRNVFDEQLRRVARQYEMEGYRVVLNPSGEQIPPFLAGYEPDILAIRGYEHVLVEVRPNRSSMSDEPGITKLAALVNSEPGWRFDLVLLEPETPVQRATEKGKEPTDEEFHSMLESARTAMSVNLTEMALTTAWALLEAAMRRLRSDGELYGGVSPMQLLGTLYSNGYLTRTEFDRAKEAWTLRTQIVHGFVSPQVDPILVNEVLSLGAKLVGREIQLHSAVAG